MEFGRARLLEDNDEKRRALTMMVDRLFPGRTAQLRQSTSQEIKATSVVWMDIETASAKIRAKGVADDEEDYDLKIYTEVIPIRVVMGAPRPCPRLQQGVDRPENLKGYRQGRLLEDAVKEGRAKSYS